MTLAENIWSKDFNHDGHVGDAVSPQTFIGHAGNETFTGSVGAVDTVDYAGATSGVTVDLSNNANNAGGAAGDKFTNIEGVIGSTS